MSIILKIANLAKPVIVTAITLKFPEECGWTKEILNKYVKKGGFLKKVLDGGATVLPYYIPEFDSIIDYDTMYKDGHVGRVLDKHLFWDIHYLSDLEVLKLKG